MSELIDWTLKRRVEDIAAEAQEARRLAVNAECRKRILAVATEDDQRNMTLAATLIVAITEASRTSEQSAILSGCNAALAWVFSMKAAATTLKANDADFSSDEAWPALPDGVLQMLDLI